MAIDYDLLRSLPVDQGYEYLRQMLSGGMDALGPERGINPYYADNPAGVVGEGGRLEGSGQLSGYQAVLGSSQPGRGYAVQFDPQGNLVDIGQQMPDSWYDREIAGVPLGAFLPLAAAGAGAMFPPGGEGLLSGAGSEVALGGTAGDTLGTTAAGFGELGSGTFGMTGGYTPAALAAAEASTLPALTSAAAGAGLTSLPSAAAIGASAVPSLLGDILSGAKSWAPLVGAAIGAATSGDKQQTQSSAREPWGPAQDWLKQTVADGRTMSDFYKRQPFSDTQKAAYQNLFNDIGNYRANIAPSLFDLANNLGRPYTPQLGNQQPGGVTGTPAPTAPAVNSDEWRRSLLTADERNPFQRRGSGGAFSMGGNVPYGQINWAALNPFSGLLGG